MSRRSRLYGACRLVKAVCPCHCARVFARAATQACIGDAQVEDLPGARLVVEGAHGFLEQHVPVPHMHPVDVDVAGAQPAQAGLQRQPQALAVIARGVGIVAIAGHRILGGQGEPVPALAEKVRESPRSGHLGS